MVTQEQKNDILMFMKQLSDIKDKEEELHHEYWRTFDRFEDIFKQTDPVLSNVADLFMRNAKKEDITKSFDICPEDFFRKSEDELIMIFRFLYEYPIRTINVRGSASQIQPITLTVLSYALDNGYAATVLDEDNNYIELKRVPDIAWE